MVLNSTYMAVPVSKHNLNDLAEHVRRIAGIVQSLPRGQWPAAAGLDSQILMLAANALVSLQRELGEVAKLGHQLMMAQKGDEKDCACPGGQAEHLNSCVYCR